jgi:uncharacterized protein YkwD
LKEVAPHAMSRRIFAVALISLGLSLFLLISCRAGVVDAPTTAPSIVAATIASPRPRPYTATHAPPHTPAPGPFPDATPAPTAPLAAEPAFIEHAVQVGDTLLGIATEYGVPMAAIQLQNGMGDSTVVQVGQVLSIPPQAGWEGASRFWVVHVVEAGETLVGVARTYGLKAAELKAVNGLVDADLIVIGQELVVPLDAPAVAQAPPSMDTPTPTAMPSSTPVPSSPLPAHASAPTPLPSTTPTAVPAAPPPADVAAWPRETVRLINQVRAQYSLPPLVYNETLALAAQAHANDCAQRGWCSHTGSDGADIKTRILRVGYDPASWAECWAQRQTPQGAVDIWMDEVPPNDPHRRTILSSALTEIGVGVVQPDWGYYFFADFATPRD